MAFEGRSSISYDRPPSDDESSTTLQGEYEDQTPKTSTEINRYDRALLEKEEEEQELLLSQRTPKRKGIFGAKKQTADGSRDLPYKRRQSDRRSHVRRELMHEMEEGGPRSRTPSSDSFSDMSSQAGDEKVGLERPRKKTSKVKKLFKFTFLHALIAALFIAIAYGAYHASTRTRRPAAKVEPMVSNGTNLFAPTTIFISLDGFRADFLQRGLTPTLNAFINEGVSPKYMTPSFPSLTFPNHYTLVTGLYPESHGIVANNFWDDEFQEEFTYTIREHSMQPKWWSSNPLWETSELQGVRTAIHMWPGSEAHIGQVEPTHMDKYNGSETLSRKVDRILEFLDKPGSKDEDAAPEDPRAQLIAAYVPDVDSDGHLYGPNSTEIRQTIIDTDNMLQSLFNGLEERNLTDIVNVIVVSDHGMATTSVDRLIQLEDIVDMDKIERFDGWPHYGLRPKDPADLPAMHERLKDEAARRDGFDVYLRDEDMPARYHFAANDRIAPLWIMAHTGWAIVTRDELHAAAAQRVHDVFHPRGIHGYDNQDPLMRAIFVARGPAFPHAPGSRLDPFENIEVYNIVCDSLGIEPAPNNGTLRLPLHPVGLHGDDTDLAEQTPHDPPQSAAAASTTPYPQATPEALTQPDGNGDGDADASLPWPTFKPADEGLTRPTISHPDDENDEQHGTHTLSAAEYWAWVKDYMHSIVDYVKTLPDRIKGEHQEAAEQQSDADSG